MKMSRMSRGGKDILRGLDDKGRKGRKGGGSEPVTVEPDRPKLGEGGAAAALEYDS